MNVGDLIRVLVPWDPACKPYLLHIVKILEDGVDIMIVSGPHFGRKHFLPFSDVREIEVLSESR